MVIDSNTRRLENIQIPGEKKSRPSTHDVLDRLYQASIPKETLERHRARFNKKTAINKELEAFFAKVRKR